MDTTQLDAVICVAGKFSTHFMAPIKINLIQIKIALILGGWAGGNASKDLAKNADLMWRQSVWSSTISATIGSQFLKPGGLLSLTGADAALNGTSGNRTVILNIFTLL